MNVLSLVKECGHVLAGMVPRRSTLVAWIAGASLAASLTAAPFGSSLSPTAHAQPQPPAPGINWVDQTWAIAPAGPGQWAVMLSMTYDKDGSVVLPVGVIAGVEKDSLTINNPPSSVYLGFTNTSVVQSTLEGTLFISAGLIAALGLDPAYDGDIFSVRWNYTHPTEGAAYVQVGSDTGSKWEPVLAKIRTHYEATIIPAQLPKWDTETTTLQDKHDQPGRVKPRPAGGGRWRWIPAIAPFFWDLIRPSAVPVPTPPAPAKAPVCKHCSARCQEIVNRIFKHFNERCVRSTCSPELRVQCAECVMLQRDSQVDRCLRLDSGVPNPTDFNSCMITCD